MKILESGSQAAFFVRQINQLLLGIDEPEQKDTEIQSCIILFGLQVRMSFMQTVLQGQKKAARKPLFLNIICFNFPLQWVPLLLFPSIP